MHTRARRWFLIGTLASGLAHAACAGRPVAVSAETPTEIMDARFRAGQRWKVTLRPGEEGATLIVLRVDSVPSMGTIVHVNLQGLRARNPGAPGSSDDSIAHAVFSEAAIARSVTTLVEERAELPAFEDDYRTWRRGFKAMRFGVINVTVAEALERMRSAPGP